MKRNDYIWNLEQTKKVKISLIREWAIDNFDGLFQVRGWTGTEWHTVHEAETKDGAVQWLDAFCARLD